MRRVIMAALLAASALCAAAGQEPGELPLRVMTAVVLEGASAETAESWAASLDAALARLDRVGAVRRVPAGKDPKAAAAAAAFDLAVVVEAGAGTAEGTLALRAAVADAVSGTELFRLEETVPAPREAELNQTFWLQLAAAVDAAEPAAAEPPQKTGGTAAASGAKTLTLESGLYMGQFADAWAGWAPGFRYRLKLGFYQFLFGCRLDGGDESAVVSFPLLQPGIGADLFLSGSTAALRYYLSAAAFVRLSGSSLLPDPIAPFGSTLMLGAERPALGKLSLFVELGAAYYPFCDGYLTAASKGVSEGGPVTFAYGDWWFLEFPQFRLGARLKL